MLGNPPWERVKLQEKEWFADRSPEIADAPNAAARKRMIRALADADPELYRAFLDALRQSEGWSHLMRNSGRYPLCARGDINSYAVFAEGMRSVLNERGRVGCVLPTGIATDWRGAIRYWGELGVQGFSNSITWVVEKSENRHNSC